MTVILAVICRFYPREWLVSTAISFGTTCYHFTMRLAAGFIVPALCRTASFRSPWFLLRSWEPALYRRMNVKNWKGNLPTYAPEQFDLRRNTLEQVIQNTCGAELVHEVIMVCSFLPLLAVPVLGAFPVFLLTGIAAALYDSIFVIAQRYNRPRLVRILEKRSLKVHE